MRLPLNVCHVCYDIGNRYTRARDTMFYFLLLDFLLCFFFFFKLAATPVSFTIHPCMVMVIVMAIDMVMDKEYRVMVRVGVIIMVVAASALVAMAYG